MRNLFNICNFYTLLWCIFLLKGSFYESSIISVSVYALIMIISACCLFVGVFQYPKFRLKSSLNLLLFLFVVYGCINIMFFDPVVSYGHVFPTDFYLQNILKSILPIYAFYVFTEKGYITPRWFVIWGPVFLVVIITMYFVHDRIMKETKFMGQDEITNNVGFYFTQLLVIAPFFYKKRIIQYIFIAITLIFIISAMKRGAILCAIIGLGLFMYYSLKNVRAKQKVILSMLIIGLLYIGYEYVLYMLSTSAYFQNRLQLTLEGYSSNRDSLYYHFFNVIINSDILEFLFGHGADGTIRLGENYAHNDWLEIGVNQGLLGIILFIFFWINLHRFWRSTKYDTVLFIAIGMFFIINLSRTIFSMSINDMSIFCTCVLGYAMSVMNHNHKKESYKIV